jgi:hypothetical protein
MIINEMILKNFLSFRNLEYKPSPNINIIFGENGSGKTNILKAFKFINEVFSKATINYQKKTINNEYTYNQEDQNQNLYEKYSTYNSNEPIEVNIKGKYQGKNFEYYISIKENDYIIKEYLKFFENSRGKPRELFLKEGSQTEVKLFKNKKFNNIIQKSITNNNNISFISSFRFSNNELKEYSTIQEEKNQEEEPVLNILEGLLKNIFVEGEYREQHNKKENDNLAIKATFFKNMNEINEQENKYLKNAETFSSFIQQLDNFSRGTVVKRTMPDERNTILELYHKKLIDGVELEIPFSHESNGTKKFIAFFNSINKAKDGYLSIFDEFNAYLHDNLVEKSIDLLKRECSDNQFFITTHNLNILNYNFLDNEEKQIIIRDQKLGNTLIRDLKGTNLRENKEHYYKLGKYGGAPSNDDITLKVGL